MIGIEDAPFAYKYDDYYKILPAINDWSEDKKRIKEGKKVREDFIYDSGSNEDWMTSEELLNWLEKNKDKIGKI